ncbi:MAG: DUF502 domain-containing protein [Gammaproteobacteria bacterium]|nr:DUF502 domain-containing protein [Gammaproteobacteria bacterium]
MSPAKTRSLHIRRYLISGIATVIPLWVTWLLLDFVLSQLSKFGRPWVRGLAGSFDERWPALAELLLHPWFLNGVAVLLVLVALYLLGWAVTRVIGKRVLALVEALFERVPLVQTIYGSVKKLVVALQQEPGDVQRVVLIDFPSRDLKAVGLVTRLLEDALTGEKLAAVYVPTTPNPTSGYLEIVPVDRLISTNWTIDEAMNFLISGGAVAPDKIQYRAASEAPAVDDGSAKR